MFDAARINTVRGKNQTRPVQIRRRKTKLASQPVAFDHTTGDGIRPAEHLARRIQIARPNGFADTRAADHLAIE